MKKVIYSNVEDCANIAIKLNNELYGKISFYGSIWGGILSGKYHVISLSKYRTYRDYEKDEVTFSIKYCKDEFLRVTVGEELYKLSTGLKLAVLSDFCEVLTKYCGKPSFYYTIKDDEYHSLNLNWSYNHLAEDLEDIKSATYFDDAIIDKLIVFNENELDDTKKQMKDEVFKKIGLPYEMLSLVEENMDDFLASKIGEPIENKKDGMKYEKSK